MSDKCLNWMGRRHHARSRPSVRLASLARSSSRCGWHSATGRTGEAPAGTLPPLATAQATQGAGPAPGGRGSALSACEEAIDARGGCGSASQTAE